MLIDKYKYHEGMVVAGMYDPTHNPIIYYAYDGRINFSEDIPTTCFEYDSIWKFIKHRYESKVLICVLYNELDLYSPEFLKGILWNKLDQALEKSLVMSGQTSQTPFKIYSQQLARVLEAKNSIPLSAVSSEHLTIVRQRR